MPILMSVALTLSTASLSAEPVPVSNHSFEVPTGSAPNGLFDPADGSIGAWSYTRTGVLPATLTDVTFGSWGAASDGSNAAQLTFLVGALATVSLFQDTGVTFAPNSIYTLTFDVDQVSPVALLSGGSASIFAGGTEVATLSGGSLLDLLDGSGPMHTFSLQYITGETAPVGNIGIGFTAGGVLEVLGSGLVVDNVRLDVTPVPEPSGALLIAAAGIWVLAARRRFDALRRSV